MISSLTYSLFWNVVFSFYMPSFSQLSFCWWFLISFHCGQRTNRIWILNFNFGKFPFSFWKEWILFLLGRVFWKYELGQIGWWYCSSIYPFSFIKNGILKSLTIIVHLSFNPCNSVNFYFMYFEIIVKIFWLLDFLD